MRITSTLAKRQWNDLVTSTSSATPFHRYEFLETLADHTNTTFHSFVAVDGSQPIGLFPVFERSVGPVTALFSPAPNCKVRYLGPVFFSERFEASRRERRKREFVETALSCFWTRFSPQYMLVRTTDHFGDPRPFVWRGFESTPQYSYVVDLRPDEETLLGSFSSDARSNIRSGYDDLTITEGGHAEIEHIVEQLKERHRQQGTSYPVTAEFVTDLYDRLPAGLVRPYVVRADDSILGGMITLENETTIYRWQGGAKPDTDRSVNECLDWHIMQEAAERGCSRYDLVGANKANISRYKSKFAPELVTFQSLIKSSRTMGALAGLYKRFR